MTISSTKTKTSEEGNGSTTVFNIPFMFSCDEDIEVILTDVNGVEWLMSITTDYTLSSNESDDGEGQCVMTTPPAEGESLLIRRVPAITQEAAYTENGPFPAASHEAALDKLTMICQALSERLDRTITFRVSSAISGIELPDPDAGRLLAWNDEANNLTNRYAADFGLVALPLSVAEGGTGGETTLAALTGLGFTQNACTAVQSEDPAEVLAALDAEPADPAIIKSDVADVIRTVYSDDYQTVTENSLSGFIPTRNKIEWVLNEPSDFDELIPDNPVSLVFYVKPNGNTLSFANAYTLYGEDFDNLAAEVRVSVDINGTDKRVTIANAKA